MREKEEQKKTHLLSLSLSPSPPRTKNQDRRRCEGRRDDARDEEPLEEEQ